MKRYINKLNISEKEIEEIIFNNPKVIIEQLKLKQDLVEANFNFLVNLGITNVKNIFVNYAEIFLLDSSLFKRKFSKYNKEDLIEKLDANMDIILFL